MGELLSLRELVRRGAEGKLASKGEELESMVSATKAGLQAEREQNQQAIGSAGTLRLQRRDSVRGFDEDELRVGEAEKSLLDYFQAVKFVERQGEESRLIDEFKRAIGFLHERERIENQLLEQEFEDHLENEPPLAAEPRFVYLFGWLASPGKKREGFVERVQAVLPEASHKLIEQAETFLSKKEQLRLRAKAKRRDFLRQKMDLLAKAEQQLSIAIRQSQEATTREIERLGREKQAMQAHEEIEGFRKQQEKRQIQAHQKKERARLEEQLEAQLKELERLKRAEKIGQVAKQFRRQKQLKEEQILERQRKKEQEEDLLKRNQLRAKLPVIKSRNRNAVEKLVVREEAGRLRSEEPLRRQKRLDEQVEGYKSRPVAEADFERLTSWNEAQRVRIEMRDKLDQADKVQLSKVTGFTEAQLMKDVRYRLSDMLQRNGLEKAQYARQLIAGMVPREQAPF